VRAVRVRARDVKKKCCLLVLNSVTSPPRRVFRFRRQAIERYYQRMSKTVRALLLPKQPKPSRRQKALSLARSLSLAHAHSFSPFLSAV
jgi:hypothetical protein